MTARIVSYKDYVAGWLDSSIHDFLEVLSPRTASTRYALITCLDSQPEPASLLQKSPELQSLVSKIEILGSGLLLPTRWLLESKNTQRLFFGFDEVWFFPGREIQPKPRTASLVGPARLTQTRLEKLGPWLETNACSLGLGGGEGLNFVVRAQGLARFLLGCSLEQAEGSLVAT
jgi:hypothetical protein